MNSVLISFLKKYKHLDREHCDFESTGWRLKANRAEVVVCRRRGCRRHAFTRFGPERVRASCLHPRVGLGNVVRDLIKLFTVGLVKPKAGCNCEARRTLLNVAFGFNLPNWMVFALEMLGKHKAQPYPWDNPRLHGLIEIGEPDRQKLPPINTKATKVG